VLAKVAWSKMIAKPVIGNFLLNFCPSLPNTHESKAHASRRLKFEIFHSSCSQFILDNFTHGALLHIRHTTVVAHCCDQQIYTDRQKLQWDSLQQRRACSKVLMLYRIRNGLVTMPAAAYLEPVPICTSRFETRYVQIQCNTGTYSQTFFPSESDCGTLCQ